MFVFFYCWAAEPCQSHRPVDWQVQEPRVRESEAAAMERWLHLPQQRKDTIYIFIKKETKVVFLKHLLHVNYIFDQHD